MKKWHGAIKGKTQNVKVKYYNLDVVLSIGYRVNSIRATQFRIWARSGLPFLKWNPNQWKAL